MIPLRSLFLLALAATLTGCNPLRLVNSLSPSDHYRLTSDLAYGSEGRQALDVYRPRATTAPSPLVVFFYGGGWRDGSKRNYRFVASSLTEAGYVVIIPDYRLFPEVTFPAFVEDSARAVAWAVENAGDYGADPDRVFLMGHSAGAHIAALLSMDARYLAAHGVDVDRLRGLVGLSGPYDFLPIESGYLLDVFPADRREASQPINFASAAAPPTLLIHGSDDELVDPSNSKALADRLTHHGVDVTLLVYEGAGHATVAAALAPPLDFSGRTFEDSRNFLDARSAEPGTAR